MRAMHSRADEGNRCEASIDYVEPRVVECPDGIIAR